MRVQESCSGFLNLSICSEICSEMRGNRVVRRCTMASLRRRSLSLEISRTTSAGSSSRSQASTSPTMRASSSFSSSVMARTCCVAEATGGEGGCSVVGGTDAGGGAVGATGGRAAVGGCGLLTGEELEG